MKHNRKTFKGEHFKSEKKIWNLKYNGRSKSFNRKEEGKVEEMSKQTHYLKKSLKKRKLEDSPSRNLSG